MRKAIVMIVVILSSACLEVQAENGRRIVLPDFKLAGSSVSNLSGIWQDRQPTDTGAIYPKQVSIDMDSNVVQGLTAVYEKSVSIGELQAAINERYGKFVHIDNSYVKVWRVVPEKFVISLSEADDGMKMVIYLKFGAVSVRPGWKCKFIK